MGRRLVQFLCAAAVVSALSITPATQASALSLGAPLGSFPLAQLTAAPTEYPSWDDVEAAKGNESSKQSEIDNINALLDELEIETARLSNEALARGAEYFTANYNAETAAAEAVDLQKRADEALAKSEEANSVFARLAVQLYKSGGDTTVNLVLDSSEADSLLYRLGTMSQLTNQSGGLRDEAQRASNQAESLQKQADVALVERDRLAQEAEDALASAEEAQEASEAKLAEQSAHQGELVAQLASLKNTSAQVEQSYRDGVASAAAAAAAEAAAAAAAAEAAWAGGDESGGGSSAWVPGSDSVATPDQAKAIAQSMMGSYGWGGGQYECLVQLWINESGWRVNAYNDSSGAYGIPQSLPANKMAAAGSDWATNAATQIKWGMDYISGRYDTPCGALDFWNGRYPHWY